MPTSDIVKQKWKLPAVKKVKKLMISFSTVKQVKQMVRIAKEIGREIATADEARRIMKIGTWYNSPDETLFSLGLPPNRTGGQQGFIVHETSGKLSKAIAHILPSGSKVDEPYIL